MPDAKSESGWPLYEVPAEGFALALPPDWRQFEMNPATFEAKFQDTVKQIPQFEDMQGDLRQQLASGVKFFGFEGATFKMGFVTKVNVFRVRLTPEATLDTVVAEGITDLENLPNITKPIVHERLKMTAGDGERIRLKFTRQMPTGQTVTLAMTQFTLVKGSDCYVVTLWTLADQADKYAPIFEKIGQSFRFIKLDASAPAS